MTAALPPGARVVLLDIEGTTTPIAFVYDVLFPFARAHLDGFLRSHAATPIGAEVERLLKAEHEADAESPPAWNDDGAAYVRWLMDRDRKSPGLKRLQGLIWEEGYRAGVLRGEVYPDVPPAIRRWTAAGLKVAIYSSGSELAQRRLFESTPHGDLSPLLAGFFDTRVGPKQASDSYARIAAALGEPPASVLFVSDVAAELDAARAAGCATLLAVRPGNAPQAGAGRFAQAATFDGL